MPTVGTTAATTLTSLDAGAEAILPLDSPSARWTRSADHASLWRVPSLGVVGSGFLFRLRVLTWTLWLASCRQLESGAVPVLEAGSSDARVALPAAAPPSSPSSPAAAVPGPAPEAACRTTSELLAEAGGSTPRPLVPGLDLDGDGVKDPVFVAGEGPGMAVLLFSEKKGCSRALGALHTNDPSSVRVRGRDSRGWAIVHASMAFTFDELEEKAVHDGKRYVIWSRRRDYPLPASGEKRTISPWSEWSLVE